MLIWGRQNIFFFLLRGFLRAMHIIVWRFAAAAVELVNSELRKKKRKRKRADGCSASAAIMQHSSHCGQYIYTGFVFYFTFFQ